MGRNNYKGLIGWLIVVVCLAEGVAVCLAQGVDGVTYDVGDSTGWTIPSSNGFYSDWARNKTFRVGDQLFFNWNGSHNVADVSEREYENCKQNEFSVVASPVFIKLTSAYTGNQYFICTVGNHCQRGQKLAINVSNSNSSTPGSASPSSASSMATGALFAVISTIVMYI
ncbi:hypothetical protein UlMin_003034 [Ulmus minor]